MSASSERPLVVVLAAGQGTRMRSPVPKVLQPLCGRPMLAWVLDQARSLDPERVALVLSPGGEAILEGLEAAGERTGAGEELTVVTQPEARGTGHAVQCCVDVLRDRPNAPVVVLYGDMPALSEATLERLVAARPAGGLSLLTAVPPDPMAFGRIVRDGEGRVVRIVEERDATPDERAIREVNAGVYCLEAGLLVDCLARLDDDNAQGELYLTDVVADVASRGLGVAALVADDHREVQGVNTLAQLAHARDIVQERVHEVHLAAGVRIEDPSTTTIDYGVTIGRGTTIFPCTVIRRGVAVGEGCEVGPFTHLRVGTALRDGAQVGNFTETKNATLGEGAKAKHLTYLGDVTVGARSNIGAGTIVANYDGTHKHTTTIGERAFVGSGSVLVAPSEVGAGSLTGAGAVVPRGTVIPPGEVWVGVPARRLRARD